MSKDSAGPPHDVGPLFSGANAVSTLRHFRACKNTKRGRCGIAGPSLESYYSMSVTLIADCLKGNSGRLLGNFINDKFTGISRNESSVKIAVFRSGLASLGYGVS